MRIALLTVAGTGLGGMQRHTHDLVAGLAQRGHEVDVITRGAPGSLPDTDENGVRWHLLDVPNRYPGLPFQHPAWRRESTRAFERLHARHPFDVVHSESVGAMGLLHAGIHKRVAVVINLHGVYLGLVKQSIRRAQIFRTREAFVRESKYLIWLTAGFLSGGGEPYRLRPCEVIVPTHQQVKGAIWSSTSSQRGSMPFPTASTPSSGDRRRGTAGSARCSSPAAGCTATRASISQFALSAMSRPSSC